MGSPASAFDGDYDATLSRLMDKVGEAQYGRDLRILERFRDASFRGYAALHPRPYDPGESPLTGGPPLDRRWHDDIFNLMEEAEAAEAGLPPDARFFTALTTVLWACVGNESWHEAVRRQAYVTALEQLDNADPEGVRFHRARANEEWAAHRLQVSAEAIPAVRQLHAGAVDPDAEREGRVLRKLGTGLEAASKAHYRAHRRTERAWARLRVGWARRTGTSGGGVRPRARAPRRRRAAARRAAGPRSGQDPGHNGKPVGVPPSLPAAEGGSTVTGGTALVAHVTPLKLTDPGLPPLSNGRTPTPAPTPRERKRTHRAAVRWIAAKFPGATKRGRAARRRWAAVPDETVMDARRGLAMEVRHFTANPASLRRAREPLADRALALETAETAAEARNVLTEIEAIGLRLGLRP